MPPLPTTPLPIPGGIGATSGFDSLMGGRRAGTLVKSEEWWRDHYQDLESHGYKLRSRYDPSWEPSWIESGKDFYAVEDGQATIVRSPYFPWTSIT
jgi:hypothetical protein